MALQFFILLFFPFLAQDASVDKLTLKDVCVLIFINSKNHHQEKVKKSSWKDHLTRIYTYMCNVLGFLKMD